MIRQEHPDDYNEVERLTIEAFSNSEFGYHGEADLIKELRSNDGSISVVSEYEGTITGHILFTPASLFVPDGEKKLNGMALGPMAVAPAVQNQGIGSKLVYAGLELLSKKKTPFVIVLGHPEFYTKFGFEAASTHQVFHGFSGIPQEVFFIKFLEPVPDYQEERILACYDQAFGPQHSPE